MLASKPTGSPVFAINTWINTYLIPPKASLIVVGGFQIVLEVAVAQDVEFWGSQKIILTS